MCITHAPHNTELVQKFDPPTSSLLQKTRTQVLATALLFFSELTAYPMAALHTDFPQCVDCGAQFTSTFRGWVAPFSRAASARPLLIAHPDEEQADPEDPRSGLLE